MTTNKSRTAAFGAPVARTDATLDDYTNFHGMLCRPSTAQRCIDSFTGTVLFMPEHGTSEPNRYDCSNGMLSLWSYYLLVVVSLTGLSTLLKQTEFLTAENVPAQQHLNVDELVSKQNNPLLSVDQNVLDYVMKQTDSSSLQLKRYFEYHFGGLVPVSVIMLHFLCDKGLLHLVEVYHVERCRTIFAFLADTLGEAVRWMVGKGTKKEK